MACTVERDVVRLDHDVALVVLGERRVGRDRERSRRCRCRRRNDSYDYERDGRCDEEQPYVLTSPRCQRTNEWHIHF